jgi:hypothetical protein
MRMPAGALTERPAASPTGAVSVLRTPQIASRIERYPVQRHRLPLSSRGRSSLSASVKVEAVTIMPAVQNPHWKPPASTKLCCRGCGCSGVPSPATVVTLAPSSRWAG